MIFTGVTGGEIISLLYPPVYIKSLLLHYNK